LELLADDEARFDRALEALAGGIEIVPEPLRVAGSLVIDRP
jgi:hypothetical protein